MRRGLSIILLCLCGAGFALGIARLFDLRFESGDIYPRYSSLRADPLGTSAYYESLNRLPGISARRDFSANDELPGGRGIAYLHLGGAREDWRDVPAQLFGELESFLGRGGRLVIAFSPEVAQSDRTPPGKSKTESKKKNPPETGPEKSLRDRDRKIRRISGSDGPAAETVSLARRWGMDIDFRRMEHDNNGKYQYLRVRNDDYPTLPPTVSWHSGVYFSNLDPAWRVIYTRETNAVMIERHLGRGSVVFASDSYFASNEAMQMERHADLLAFLAGTSQTIVFDEAHFGIVVQPGVAALMREYRLGGLIAAFLLLAVLFIWKNSLHFGAAPPSETKDEFVAGRDSTAGFVNLLRHHLPAGELLNICLAEWVKSGADQKFPPARRERVRNLIAAEQALPAARRDAVGAYRAVCQILTEKSIGQSEVPAAKAIP